MDVKTQGDIKGLLCPSPPLCTPLCVTTTTDSKWGLGPRQGSVSWLDLILPILQMLALKSIPVCCPREGNGNQVIPSSGLRALMLFSAHVFLLPSAQTAIQSCQFYLVNPFRASCPLSHLNLSCAWHTLDAQLSVPGVLERSLYSWVLSPTSWYFAMNFLKHGAIFFLCEYLMGLFSLFISLSLSLCWVNKIQ